MHKSRTPKVEIPNPNAADAEVPNPNLQTPTNPATPPQIHNLLGLGFSLGFGIWDFELLKYAHY
jgi:hypothetical protein